MNYEANTTAPSATETKTAKTIPTAQQFRDELDRLVELPENEKQYDRYLDTLLLFYLAHPDEATPFLRAVLPKVTSFSNNDVRLLGQMCAAAFPEASFPYIPFGEKGTVSAESVRHWFADVVVPSAFLARIRRQFEKLVYLGLWAHFKGQQDLCRFGTLAEELEDESKLVWAWAARNAKSLMREKPSRIGTRLKEYATQNVARTWKTLALRAKAKGAHVFSDDIERPRKKVVPMITASTAEGEPKSKTTALYCVPCQGLKSVTSEAEGLLQLECRHARPSTFTKVINTE